MTFTSTVAELKTIMASSGDLALEEKRVVVFNPGPPETVSVAAESETLKVGESTRITVTVTDAYGNRIKSDEVSFEATVGEFGDSVNNGDGTYSATYTAPTQLTGTVEITARTENDKTGSVLVSVKDDDELPLKSIKISVIPEQVRVQVGETSATFFIQIEGIDSFEGDVELFAADLPGGVQSQFDPKKESLSKEVTKFDSQLTLTLPDLLNIGDYPFTILVAPARGESERLTPTLTIEPADKRQTVLGVAGGTLR